MVYERSSCVWFVRGVHVSARVWFVREVHVRFISEYMGVIYESVRLCESECVCVRYMSERICTYVIFV